MLNMKRTGLLSTLVALMLVIAATTAFATVVPSDPAPAADLVNLIEDTGNSLVLDRTVDGEREISTDGGNTWMTPDEYEATQGTLNIEWWTVETYEEWLRTEKIELPKIIGSRSYNQIDGWFTWTQARVDETIAMYESTLEDLKNGMMVSRSVDGKDDLKIATMPDSDSVSFSNKTVASDGGVLHEDRAQTDAVASDVTFSLSQSTKAETQEGYSATITLNDGEEYILDSFATKAERYDAVQSFCLRMIEAGRMTSSEAEDILETIK